MITVSEVRDFVMNKHKELVAKSQYNSYFDCMLSSIRRYFYGLQTSGRLGMCHIDAPTTVQDIEEKNVKYHLWWIDDDGKIPHGGGELEIAIDIDDVMSKALLYHAGC